MADSLLPFKILQRFTLLLITIFIAFCVLTTPTQSIQYSSASNGMILDLIHRETIYPTTYPPGSTLSDRVDLALSRILITRNGDHKNLINANLSSDIEPSGDIFPGVSTFYVSFYMGSMFVPQIASLDTGSRFLWIQCEGSTGHKTANPVYDPGDSHWYVPSTCLPSGDYYCRYLRYVPGSGECDQEFRCTYSLSFGDGSYSRGFIGFENITFVSAHRQIFYTVPNVTFGCGMDNFNTNKREDGVFGIGTILSLAITKTTGYQFSFCFGGIINEQSPSHLALGQEAHLLGNPVPLKPYPLPSYFVTLQGIVFGESDRIPMSPIDVVIDTGTTGSFLSNDIYTNLRSKVDGLIGNKMEKIQTSVVPDGLCYKAETLISDFPTVTLELGPYTGLVLDITGMFWRIPEENAYCFSFFPTNGFNMLGAVQMQFHNVAFDLFKGQAYFFRVDDCRQLYPPKKK